MLGDFETTSWSMVLSAKNQDTSASDEALNALCRTYWPCLYTYIRRKGYSEEDARDLTQEFFSHLLAKGFLENVDRSRGRFRSFLLTALNHFLVDEWKKARAQKRGGAEPRFRLDFPSAERRYAMGSTNTLDPRVLFERQWAQTILETVMDQLANEYARAGKSAVFEGLKGCLIPGETEFPYRALGDEMAMSEGAVRVAVHRLRRRYGVLLRAEVVRTVERPEDVEEELRYLMEVIGSQ